jgi:hypothetical protein
MLIAMSLEHHDGRFFGGHNVPRAPVGFMLDNPMGQICTQTRFCSMIVKADSSFDGTCTVKERLMSY